MKRLRSNMAFRWGALGLITGLFGLAFWRLSITSVSEYAFLVKSGAEFSLVHVTPGEVLSETYSSLSLARAAMATQGLTISPTGRPHLDLQKSWYEEENVLGEGGGKQTVLFWKLKSSAFIFRLTFNSRNDAEFFYLAFLKGAYTPSPHGHSVFLVRR